MSWSRASVIGAIVLASCGWEARDEGREHRVLFRTDAAAAVRPEESSRPNEPAADGGAHSAHDATVAEGSSARTEWHDTGADAGSDGAVSESLALEVVSEAPLGSPFALSVSTSSGAPLSATVRVSANGVPSASLQLYRGRGSASLVVSQAGPLLLQAWADHAYGERQIEVRARPLRRYESSPDAGAEALEWTAQEDIAIEGLQRVAARQSLTIGPGTRVLMGDKAILAVDGELRVLGSAEAPVLFTRAGAAAWGGVYVQRGAHASLDHAWFVAGGGDDGRAFGHSSSQPVLFVGSSSLDMRGGGLIDNIGKAFGASDAKLALDGTLISRCDTGGEFHASQLDFKHLHVLELPDADGRVDDDDNDGFYVFHSTSDDAGVDALIADSVFVVGEDDAIDQNGARLRLERVWIEGFRHEGVACSSGREVNVRESVVRGCEQGIEAGYGAPRVRVENSLVTGNGVGLRVGDDHTWDTNGSLEASHSIIVGNTQNVRNYVTTLDGPLPDALRVRCTVVDDAQLAGQEGNVSPPIQNSWPAGSCSAEALLDPMLCGSAGAGPPCP